MKAAANDDDTLRAIGARLRDVLPRVPSSYRGGRAALIEALAEREDVSAARAGALLTELEELGVIKYTTEGRGIGVAGLWTYPRTATSRPKTPVRARRRRA